MRHVCSLQPAACVAGRDFASAVETTPVVENQCITWIRRIEPQERVIPPIVNQHFGDPPTRPIHRDEKQRIPPYKELAAACRQDERQRNVSSGRPDPPRPCNGSTDASGS